MLGRVGRVGRGAIGRRVGSSALNALTLSASSIAENSASGTVVGAVQGLTAGSTLSITDTAGSRFALSGNNVVAGATATDFESATSHNITLRETLAGASNSPRDTTLTITVTDVTEWGSTGSAWNPSDKASQITLSNNDRSISSSNAGAGVRGMQMRSSGQRHLEFRYDGIGGAGGQPVAGVATAAHDLVFDTNPASSPTVRGVWLEADGAVRVWTGDVENIGSISAGQIVGCEVDLDTKEVWFIRSGTRHGPYSYDGYGLSSELYPLGGAASSGGSPSLTLNTGGGFATTVTSGFSAWG